MQYILVVEDDYDLNQAICYSLKKSGYGVYGVTFMEILLRKIDVILKRTASANHRIFTDENLYIDLDNARVMVKGQESSVTPTEYRLLCQFLMNRGQLLTYDLLLERLWDSGGQFVDRHALAVNINRLRGKIEDKDHRYISNVYGMGYQWIG